jgi:methionyl-tRNA formyltransferase
MSEVKQRALELTIPVLQPDRVKDPAFVDEIRRRKPRLIVVAAYGQILPGTLLEIPEMGSINVHASLLPKHRGAAPISWAIAEGESQTGVTTILMDEGMDTGPILLARAVFVDPRDTAGFLELKLAEVGAAITLETIRGLEQGTLRPMPQDSSQATYAPPFTKEDGRIDWSQPAIVLQRRIRALNPWPGTFTRLGGKNLRVFWAEVDETPSGDPPGWIVDVGREGIRVATGHGHIILKEIQLEGRKRLPVREFLLGHPVEAGTVLG